jgi:hypothetical protein
VIRIRYSDLPAGLHASAKSEGRHTVIYLVPGLSAADKRSAIGRLRASARVGHGPKLPAVSLMTALIADRVRFNLRNAAVAARLHPTGLAIPVAVLTGGAILYGLLVTVSIRIGPSSPQASQARLPLSVAMAPATGGTSQRAARTGPTSASRLSGNVASAPAGPSGVPGSTGPGGVVPGSRQVVGARPDPWSGPTPSPSGSTPPPGQPSPSPSTSPPGHPSPPPTTDPPSPTPSPSPTHHHGGGSGGICLNLGLLGICLNL